MPEENYLGLLRDFEKDRLKQNPDRRKDLERISGCFVDDMTDKGYLAFSRDANGLIKAVVNNSTQNIVRTSVTSLFFGINPTFDLVNCSYFPKIDYLTEQAPKHSYNLIRSSEMINDVILWLEKYGEDSLQDPIERGNLLYLFNRQVFEAQR